MTRRAQRASCRYVRVEGNKLEFDFECQWTCVFSGASIMRTKISATRLCKANLLEVQEKNLHFNMVVSCVLPGPFNGCLQHTELRCPSFSSAFCSHGRKILWHEGRHRHGHFHRFSFSCSWRCTVGKTLPWPVRVHSSHTKDLQRRWLDEWICRWCKNVHASPQHGRCQPWKKSEEAITTNLQQGFDNWTSFVCLCIKVIIMSA